VGKYDEIRPDHLRADLVRFAELILRLEKNNLLLRSAPEIQRLIGDLRQKLFAYEVRSTTDFPSLTPHVEEEEDDPLIRESLRVVREAMERQREITDEWGGPD
jgi:hypothetical protein